MANLISRGATAAVAGRAGAAATAVDFDVSGATAPDLFRQTPYPPTPSRVRDSRLISSFFMR
jgi:hypothetical protein